MYIFLFQIMYSEALFSKLWIQKLKSFSFLLITKLRWDFTRSGFWGQLLSARFFFQSAVITYMNQNSAMNIFLFQIVYSETLVIFFLLDNQITLGSFFGLLVFTTADILPNANKENNYSKNKIRKIHRCV